MKKVKVIKVKQDQLLSLMERTGKSRSAVYMALRFATSGEDPDRIRTLALNEYGGVIDTVTRL